MTDKPANQDDAKATDTLDTQDSATEPQTDESSSEPKLEQDVQIEEVGPALKRMTITIPASRIADKIDEQFGTLGNEAVIPGFRRGRAPRRLIEKRFGQSVRDEVRGQLISESYSQVIEDEKLEVLGEPDVKDIETLELPESGPLTFEVEVEVSPELELPDFSKLKVVKRTFEVTDEDVAKEIENYRERMGNMTEIEDENATLQVHDYAQASLKVLAGEDASDDAEALIDLPMAYTIVHGEEHDYKGHIGGLFVSDLGKQLLGKKKGDVVRISMTGPETHQDERIRQQPITLVITVLNIQRIEPASIETLIEGIGAEDEKDLNSRIRTMLESRSEREQIDDMHSQLREQLLEQVSLTLPEGITQRQSERVLQRERMNMMYQGATEEEIEGQLAELRANSEKTAREDLKLFFILDRAAKSLDVEVTQDEINGRITMQAMQSGRRPEKLRAEMMESGQLESLYMSLRDQKTLDAIIEKAEVEEAAPEEASDEPDKKKVSKKSKKKTTKADKKED